MRLRTFAGILLSIVMLGSACGSSDKESVLDPDATSDDLTPGPAPDTPDPTQIEIIPTNPGINQRVADLSECTQREWGEIRDRVGDSSKIEELQQAIDAQYDGQPTFFDPSADQFSAVVDAARLAVGSCGDCDVNSPDYRFWEDVIEAGGDYVNWVVGRHFVGDGIFTSDCAGVIGDLTQKECEDEFNWWVDEMNKRGLSLAYATDEKPCGDETLAP